jgi:hypothetical protein
MFLTLAGKNITETKPDDAKTRPVAVAALFKPTQFKPPGAPPAPFFKDIKP